MPSARLKIVSECRASAWGDHAVLLTHSIDEISGVRASSRLPVRRAASAMILPRTPWQRAQHRAQSGNEELAKQAAKPGASVTRVPVRARDTRRGR
jgi:hypothetical protein